LGDLWASVGVITVNSDGKNLPSKSCVFSLLSPHFENKISTYMIVIGADVGKGSLVCAVLRSENIDVREFNLFGEYYTIDATVSGLNKLLSLNPDVVVMEPTGVNYLKIWASHLARAGIEVALVGHKQLRSHRIDLSLPDKDDYADALALGCYYLKHRGNPLRFVRIRDSTTSELRDRVLRIKHINRVRIVVSNRLKQDLAWAFPEMAHISDDAPLFWGWLAGERKSVKYDALYQASCGNGIDRNIRVRASIHCQLLREELELDREMRSFLVDPQYLPYLKVMRKYGIGDRAAAMIISQFFPLSNFLGEDGEPLVILAPSKKTGKLTRRHLSLRRFRKTMGVAPVREQSGKSPEKTKKAGSQLVRNELWLWIWRNFERKNVRLNPFLTSELMPIWEKLRGDGKTISRSRSIFAFKVIDRLFYDLVRILK
jgi:transposase